MKVLFLTTQIPYPADNGIRIVPYNAMRLLAAEGVELGLCVLTKEDLIVDQAELDSRMSMLQAKVALEFATWTPAEKRSKTARLQSLLLGKISYVADYKSDKYLAEIERKISQFQPDVVHFDHIALLQYRAALSSGIGTVASINDSHTLTLAHQLRNRRDKGLARIARYTQFLQTRRLERKTYALFDAIHVMTVVDAEYLRRLCGLSHVDIIPNGVDDSLFEVAPTAGVGKRVVFVGRLHGNNLHSVRNFIEQGWPVVLSEHPDAELHLVGGAEEAVKQQLSTYASEGIVLRGYVGRLVEAYSDARVSISPIDKDSGVLNKTIEAMAAGIPVVSFESSLKGLVEGGAGFDALSGQTYVELGKAVSTLLEDSARCRSMSEANRSYALHNYSWATRATEYLEMYKNAVQKAQSRTE